MHRFAPLAILLAASAAMAGCKRAPKPASETRPAALGADVPEGPAPVTHGTRKQRQLDAPVFVDGQPVAVLRFGDLPVLPREVLEGDVPSYRVRDYLAALAIPLAEIRAVHFHGNGDRIASITGAELRREPGRFTFTFASSTTGAATQRWSTEGLANEFVAHEIRKVSVFVAKAPASIHPTKRCHLDAAGACSDAVPYAAAEPPKGTRVLVDGRMVGAVKRRLVGDALALGGSGEDATFSVAKLAKSFGAPDDAITTVELVAGDDVVARADAAQWKRLRETLSFTLPRHQHGKVRVRVPAELQLAGATSDVDALVSAIVFYRRERPAPRPLARVSEETDTAVQLATASSNEVSP